MHWRRGLGAAIVGAALTLVLGGCELLLGPAFGPGPGPGFEPSFSPDFEDPFPSPSQIAVYNHGSATIRISTAGTADQTLELSRFYAGATADNIYGAQAHWSDGGSWHLRISGAGSSEEGFGGYLAFDRLLDGQHWTSLGDEDACDVHVTTMTADAFRGTATCTGVQWFDELSSMDGPGDPKPIDEPAFDAEVTFEATR